MTRRKLRRVRIRYNRRRRRLLRRIWLFHSIPRWDESCVIEAGLRARGVT